MKIVIYDSNSTKDRSSPQVKPFNAMRRIILIVLVGVCCHMATVSGQDIHFSQFYMSPLNLNPAMTGVINCDQRFVVNYRNQWAGVLGANAYNTFSASYDRKMAVGRDDFFGVGGTLWGDVAGSTKFGTRQARVSFAYSKKMGGRRKVSHYLSVGADAGLTQRRVDVTDLRWPTQVTNGQPDPSKPGEQIPNADFLFADFSGGIMWFSTLGDRKTLYGGASLHHLNQANVSFLGRQESLFSRLTVFAGGEYPINRKVSLKPDLIFMSQGPHKEINVGAAARFSVGPNARGVNQPAGQFFQIGAWYRGGNKVDGGLHSDAFIFATRFEFDSRYNIGLSYDYNVSQLSAAAAANGSFELSLVYLICGSGSSQVYCPVF